MVDCSLKALLVLIVSILLHILNLYAYDSSVYIFLFKNLSLLTFAIEVMIASQNILILRYAAVI